MEGGRRDRQMHGKAGHFALRAHSGVSTPMSNDRSLGTPAFGRAGAPAARHFCGTAEAVPLSKTRYWPA